MSTAHTTSELARFAALSEVEVAWAAGFLDADGSLSLTRAVDRRRTRPFPHHHRPVMRVSQTTVEPIEKLQSIFGGGKRRYSRGEWVWQLENVALIAAAIERLIPHLVRKRPEAELMLRYCRGPGRNLGRRRLTPERWREREDLCEQLADLREVRRG